MAWVETVCTNLPFSTARPGNALLAALERAAHHCVHVAPRIEPRPAARSVGTRPSATAVDGDNLEAFGLHRRTGGLSVQQRPRGAAAIGHAAAGPPPMQVGCVDKLHGEAAGRTQAFLPHAASGCDLGPLTVIPRSRSVRNL